MLQYFTLIILRPIKKVNTLNKLIALVNNPQFNFTWRNEIKFQVGLINSITKTGRFVSHAALINDLVGVLNLTHLKTHIKAGYDNKGREAFILHSPYINMSCFKINTELTEACNSSGCLREILFGYDVSLNSTQIVRTSYETDTVCNKNNITFSKSKIIWEEKTTFQQKSEQLIMLKGRAAALGYSLEQYKSVINTISECNYTSFKVNKDFSFLFQNLVAKCINKSDWTIFNDIEVDKD